MKTLSKNIIIILLSLISSLSFAYNVFDVYIDKPVYDEMNALQMNEEAQELALEAISQSGEYFAVGDDGISCNSEVISVNFNKVTQEKIQMSFRAIQSKGTYGCGIDSWCEVNVDRSSYPIEINTDCKYLF